MYEFPGTIDTKDSRAILRLDRRLFVAAAFWTHSCPVIASMYYALARHVDSSSYVKVYANMYTHAYLNMYMYVYIQIYTYIYVC